MYVLLSERLSANAALRIVERRGTRRIMAIVKEGVKRVDKIHCAGEKEIT